MLDSERLPNFSLTIGGPLYQLYERLRLLRPPLDLLERRLLAAVTLTWIPLLTLTIADGTALTHARVPFLLDLGVHIRLLLALPLLIAAEPLVHRRLVKTVRQFIERGLVTADDRTKFDAIIDTTVRMRNSVPVEIALLLLSTVISVAVRAEPLVERSGMWHTAHNAAGTSTLTPAGWWYALISLNAFRFVLLRWYYRLIIWYRFLWRTARLKLRLNPLHPDRAAGLGFLGGSVKTLTAVFLPQALAVAGAIAGGVLQDGIKFDSFTAEIAAFLCVIVALSLLPLAFFSPALIRSRTEGVREYDDLSIRYVDDFRRKWLQKRSAPPGQLLGSADIQSLADLANGYGVVSSVRLLPIGLRPLVNFVIVIAAPFLPLALTMIPLTELLRRLVTKLI